MSEIVERVLKIFDEKKLLGRQDTWGVEAVDGTYKLFPGHYCCGIAALLIDQPVQLDETGHPLDHEAAAVKALGLHPYYVEGYWNGFDGGEPPKAPTPEYASGFEDGRSTWNALVKKNRIYITEEMVEKEMAEPDYDNGPQG